MADYPLKNPTLACYKAPGLCCLRTNGESRFVCAFNPAACRYLKQPAEEKTNKELWEEMGQGGGNASSKND